MAARNKPINREPRPNYSHALFTSSTLSFEVLIACNVTITNAEDRWFLTCGWVQTYQCNDY